MELYHRIYLHLKFSYCLKITVGVPGIGIFVKCTIAGAWVEWKE